MVKKLQDDLVKVLYNITFIILYYIILYYIISYSIIFSRLWIIIIIIIIIIVITIIITVIIIIKIIIVIIITIVIVIIVVITIIIISILLIRCLWSFFPCLLYELLLTRNRLLISQYNRTTIFILSPCSVTLFISVLCRFYSFTLNFLRKKLRRNYWCFDT